MRLSEDVNPRSSSLLITAVARTPDLEYIPIHPANQNNPAHFGQLAVTPQPESKGK
jgi:hypothetical protein